MEIATEYYASRERSSCFHCIVAEKQEPLYQVIGFAERIIQLAANAY